MSIWKQGTEEYSTLVNGFIAFNFELVYSLTFTPTQNLTGAFLYTTSTYAGYLSAKLDGWSSYKNLGVYSTEATCFLGELEADTDYDIDLKVVIPQSSGLSGELLIPIYVGVGEIGIEDYENLFEDENNFWYSSPEEAVAGWWR